MFLPGSKCIVYTSSVYSVSPTERGANKPLLNRGSFKGNDIPRSSLLPCEARQGAAVVLAKEVPRAVAKTLLPGLFKKPGVGEQTSALENSGLFGCFFLLICASDFFLTCQSITCCGQGNACSINKQSLDKDVGVGAEKKLAM